MQVAAHPHQNPPRGDRREELFIQAERGIEQILNAIRLAQQPPLMEGIDVDGAFARLVAAEKVPRQPDADHREAKPSRDEHTIPNFCVGFFLTAGWARRQ